MQINVIRSSRKSCSLEIGIDLTVTARVPQKYTDEQVERFIGRNSQWIAANIEKQKQRNAALSMPADTDAELLKRKAHQTLPLLIEKYSRMTGLVPTGVHITSARKRLGSCSSKNSLNFSYMLMLYPPEAIEYVVLHEIAHIKEHNHSKRFYALIERYMPDYRERIKLIRG